MAHGSPRLQKERSEHALGPGSLTAALVSRSPAARPAQKGAHDTSTSEALVRFISPSSRFRLRWHLAARRQRASCHARGAEKVSGRFCFSFAGA